MNPLYLAAAGAAIGAVADKDKPLRGAAIGGLAGYTGGSALGASGGAGYTGGLTSGAGLYTSQALGPQPVLSGQGLYTSQALGGSGVVSGAGGTGFTPTITAGQAGLTGSQLFNNAAPGALNMRNMRMANSMMNNNQKQQQQAPAPVMPPQMGEYQSFAKLSPYSNRIGPSGTINSSTYF